jgi:hypothetical protein
MNLTPAVIISTIDKVLKETFEARGLEEVTANKALAELTLQAECLWVRITLEAPLPCIITLCSPKLLAQEVELARSSGFGEKDLERIVSDSLREIAHAVAAQLMGALYAENTKRRLMAPESGEGAVVAAPGDRCFLADGTRPIVVRIAIGDGGKTTPS